MALGRIQRAGGVSALAALWVALCVLPGELSAQFSAGEAAARMVSAAGDVSVIRNESLWVLFPNDSVNVGETIVTGDDGFAEFEVSDGSSFQVYPSSRVVFRKNPGSLRDLLDIFLGRVKIHIQRLGGQPNRHRIFTPTAIISVRGTVFEISVDEMETTVVAVDEGLVGVSHRLLPGREEIPVEAGQSLIVYRDQPLAKAGVDRLRVVRAVEGLARAAASILYRNGGSGGSVPSGGGTGGTGGGVPGDTEAPPPPPRPGDTEAPSGPVKQ